MNTEVCMLIWERGVLPVGQEYSSVSVDSGGGGGGEGGVHHHKLRLAMNTDFCTDSRKCPLCRTQSDFVTPSQLWVETQEEKTNLIQGYKTALKSVSDYPSATLILPPLLKPPSRRTCFIILSKLFFTAMLIPLSDTWMCTCIVCVCACVYLSLVLL